MASAGDLPVVGKHTGVLSEYDDFLKGSVDQGNFEGRPLSYGVLFFFFFFLTWEVRCVSWRKIDDLNVG